MLYFLKQTSVIRNIGKREVRDSGEFVIWKKDNFFCFCSRFSFLNQKILKPTVENASEIRYIILFSVRKLHNFY